MQKIRRLPLHQAYNVRDLGGYAIDDRRMTCWHALYRADGLHQLDEHDWRYLKDLNVKWIIDLRSVAESQSASYDSEAHGIQRVSIPFMKETEVVDPSSLQEKSREELLSSMKLDYVDMISGVLENVVVAMDVIANALSRHEALVFHCSAGKDRTGMLAALLLDLCGVSEFDILADYQVSNTYNTLGINQMIPEEHRDHPVIKGMFASSPDMMQPLLDVLHQDGCDAYLRNAGVNKETLDTIRKYFIKES